MNAMQTRTLIAMRRDRCLTMLEARMESDNGRRAEALERCTAARRINRAIVHYLRHVVRAA
jgi:hypothetical protein